MKPVPAFRRGGFFLGGSLLRGCSMAIDAVGRSNAENVEGLRPPWLMVDRRGPVGAFARGARAFSAPGRNSEGDSMVSVAVGLVGSGGSLLRGCSMAILSRGCWHSIAIDAAGQRPRGATFRSLEACGDGSSGPGWDIPEGRQGVFRHAKTLP